MVLIASLAAPDTVRLLDLVLGEVTAWMSDDPNEILEELILIFIKSVGSVGVAS